MKEMYHTRVCYTHAKSSEDTSNITMLWQHASRAQVVNRSLMKTCAWDQASHWLLRLDWTSLNTQICWTALSIFSLFPHTEAHVRYDLAVLLMYDTIWLFSLYNINLGATHTMILSIRGVTIPIYLVSSTTDSIRWCIVLFKAVTIPTSDLKSEFLCQLSPCCAEPADPPEPPCTPGISPTPSSTTYHPYAQSPSALTKYLKQKLRLQCTKCLSCSHSAQVEQSVPLKCNTDCTAVMSETGLLRARTASHSSQNGQWIDKNICLYQVAL